MLTKHVLALKNDIQSGSGFIFYFSVLCFVLFCFLGLHLQHMEFPRLGIESEL